MNVIIKNNQDYLNLLKKIEKFNSSVCFIDENKGFQSAKNGAHNGDGSTRAEKS